MLTHYQKQHQKQSGFSLIELIIVVVLLGILAGFAIPSYREMIQNSQIKTAAEGIVAGFQIARGAAVSSNRSVQLELNIGGGTSSAWNVVCTPPINPDELVEGKCGANGVIEGRLESEGSSNTITAIPTMGRTYVFNGFGVMTSPAGAPQITVDSTDTSINSRELLIVIGAGGAVRTCDPALSASGTDPRRC